MNTAKKGNKKALIALVVLLVVAIAAAGLYFIFAPKGVEGSKTIGVSVVLADQSTKEYSIDTDEEFLRGAMESRDLVSGTESEYGLFVTTVDGVTADDSQQQWWSITKDGEMVTTGIDTTPIADGDHFEFTLTTGW